MRDPELSTLTEALKHQLPQASERHLWQLARMLAAPTSTPDRQTIAGLLDEGSDPNSLHAAILFGRDRAIEMLTISGGLAPVSTVVSRFDRMVSILMHILVEQLEDRLHTAEDRLSDSERESLLARAAVHWMHEGKVDLYNYFLEMPIKVQAIVRDAHEQTLSVERSNDLIRAIAAGEHGRHIMTILPGSSLVLRLAVAGTVRDRIHLKYAGVFPQVRERRLHMRVQPDPLLPVALEGIDGKEASAKALDFSENGMGLIVHQPLTVQVGDNMDADWQVFGKPLQSTATVRWLKQDEGHTRMGIELIPNGDARLELQQMVARTQHSILARLRMRGIPDILL